MDALLILTKALAQEKFSPFIPTHALNNYIALHFSKAALIPEINSMSNQWLVVYADDDPAGYARITSKGHRPAVLEGRRAMRIADFGVLKNYTDPAIKASLFEKCISVCKSYEAAWINEYAGNPLIPFFESNGFTRQQEAFRLDELPIPSVCLTLQPVVL